MRIRLPDLFAILGFAAIVGWGARQIGFANFNYWLTVVFQSLFVIGFTYLGAGRPWIFCLVLAGTLALVLPMPFLWLLLLLFAATIADGTAKRPLPRRGRLYFGFAAMATAIVFGVVPGWRETRHLREMRLAYPVQSLAERLSYETVRSSRSPAPQIVLSTIVTTRLAEDEAGSRFADTGGRRRYLSRLHAQAYDEFVRAIGFGYARMYGIFRADFSRLCYRPIENIELQPAAAPSQVSILAAPEELIDAGFRRHATEVHGAGRRDFLDPESFGAVIEPHRFVAGFVEHAFHEVPASDWGWRIDRLELVSLLKFEEPRVYVLDHLPRMDQLSSSDASTRPLDRFESAALERLWTEEDLVIDGSDHKIRMLGSLRATNQCLDCHTVARGALLGAFSYELYSPAKSP